MIDPVENSTERVMPPIKEPFDAANGVLGLEMQVGLTLDWHTIPADQSERNRPLFYLPGTKLLTELPPDIFVRRRTNGGADPDRMSIDPMRIESVPNGDYIVMYKKRSYVFSVKRIDSGVFFYVHFDTASKEMDERFKEMSARDTQAPQVRFDSSDSESTIEEDNGTVNYFSDAVFNTDSMVRQEIPTIYNHLMESLGLPIEIHKDRELFMAPTPQTLQRLLAARGINTALISGTLEGNNRYLHNAMPPQAYASAVTSGAFPFGISDLCYYMHDLGSPHLTALVLLGDKLLQRFQMPLANNMARYSSVTRAVDQLTPYIYGAVQKASYGYDPTVDVAGAEWHFNDIVEIDPDDHEFAGMFIEALRKLPIRGDLKEKVKESLSRLEKSLAGQQIRNRVQ